MAISRDSNISGDHGVSDFHTGMANNDSAISWPGGDRQGSYFSADRVRTRDAVIPCARRCNFVDVTTPAHPDQDIAIGGLRDTGCPLEKLRNNRFMPA